MFTKIQTYAKFVAALLTVLVTAGVGLIPGDSVGWVQLAIALLGTVAVYVFPNATPVTPAAHEL